MKNEFKIVEIEIIRFDKQDIIVTSTGAGSGSSSGDDNNLEQ